MQSPFSFSGSTRARRDGWGTAGVTVTPAASTCGAATIHVWASTEYRHGAQRLLIWDGEHGIDDHRDSRFATQNVIIIESWPGRTREGCAVCVHT